MTKTWKVSFGMFAGGLVATLLTACGGSGGGTSGIAATVAPAAPVTIAAAAPAATFVGTFTDAPVVGAKYTTSSGSGGCVASAPCTTGSQGEFSYASADIVTFLAAGVTLGSTSSLSPAADGSTTVTPVHLVAGATAATDAGPTAIAQFLQTLSDIATGTTGSGGTGLLTIPTDSETLKKLTDGISAAKITAIGSTSTATLQSAVDTSFGANQFTVVPAATAQAALSQGVNSNGVIGTVWKGTEATIYFEPGGKLTGFTNDGSLLAGSWAGSTTAGGGVTMQAAGGNSYGTGSIAANSSTATVAVFDNSGVSQGTYTFNKVTVSGTSATNTKYIGGWYGIYTPTAASAAAGDTGGNGYVVAASDGKFYGITDGSANLFNGTWDPATGKGTATWTDPFGTFVMTMDLASLTGAVTRNGQAAGTLALSRTGTLTRKNNQNNVAVNIPLLLNVVVSWSNAGGNTVSGLALGLSIFDASGKLVASGVRSESTSPRFDKVRTSTSDNIAVPYPKGSASTYKLSVGQSNCIVTGGGGAINDANSSNASAYPTVFVTCDSNANTGGALVPLLLNVANTWGTSCCYALTLTLKDASGSQIARSSKQESVVLPRTFTNGVVNTASTTDQIAASYPTGGATSYAVTVGSSTTCKIASGASGSVVDANKNNAAAYATVVVTCL